ncbi:hypothetical protein K7395_24660 [Streptomyces filamentosus]|uniref:Uncharacterized protein n=2 Tax=Streptomyces filamentosus TaxID=67294 RepID=A0ABY4UZB6_STRFL|nr:MULTISPECIES: hypothetical protein [Streptomyces]EFE74516.1 predicted protein [Streptomyces filamentosus NRRL 15998]EWS91686.1 hypothetical protein SSIG_02134 [Streptomyces filamentosus NRRL 11379]MYR78647.1 hypothetical protein [Streptomyces sp. SID5466]USC49681.1 hypothetical protein K7395_24660 [Streptomyces filamentosus]
MPGLFISTMRTAVPLVAGWLLTLAANAGLDLDSTAATGAVTIALALAYYLLFRLLELVGQRADGTALQNIAGALLGWARPPKYPKIEPALDPVEPSAYRGGSTSLS